MISPLITSIIIISKSVAEIVILPLEASNKTLANIGIVFFFSTIPWICERL